MVELRSAPVLPEGPVTIMFTDIEGSTTLRTTLGDAETDALFREHDELVRAQVAEHHGYDQHAALGDGFLVVFVSTKRAVACAIAIQRALDAFNRKRSGPGLEVRIGLNTGEVTQANGQISGEAVHAAARVCAAAKGRQVLISDITRQLAGTVPDVTYRDIGEHELKGFPTPWRLWDVIWVRESAAAKENVFVAREEQLGVLRDRVASTIDGHGSLVLIGGEPGVGKTALVRRVINEAERRGALAVFGRCYESEGSVAYSPFVEMLEQALSLMPADVVREDMADDAPEIARMVPELRRRFPDIPQALDIPPEQQRRYFFNAVGSFVARGAKRFPLVMMMDDIHWADESTLLLIEHIAQLVPNHRILGIGTYRDVELEVSRPLAASLERMVRSQTVERIHLTRFGVDDVGRMIEGLAGRTPPRAIVEAVHSETEGNPFFVGEVYRHFVEEGRVFDEDGAFRTDLQIDELDVPESVRLVVGRRLERLGAEPQKALAAAAVIGRAFPFRLLEQVTELPANTLLDIVDDAEAARVLVSEERDGEVVFSFAHELIRQTLLSGLSVLRRQRLHLAVADAIERIDSHAATLRPQELADHLLKAGAAADPKRLTNMLTAAAERAIDGAAFESALRLLDDALALIDDSDDERNGELFELRGTALRALGRLEDCLETWQEAVAHHLRADNHAAAGLLSWQMGILQMWLGRMEDAFVTFDAAVREIGDEEVPERLLVGAGGAGLLGFAGMYDAAMTTIHDARAASGDVTDPRCLGVMSWTESLIGWSYGRLDDCVVAGRAAVRHLRETTDAWTLADAIAWLSFGLLWSGHRDEARELAAEGSDLAARIGHTGTLSLCARTVAWADYLLDADIQANLRAAQADLPMLEAINSPWIALTHAWLSVVHRTLGNFGDAGHHASEATRLMPPSAWSGMGEGAAVVLRAYEGDRTGCLALLDAADLFHSATGPRPAGQEWLSMSALEAVSILGLAEHARRLYPEALRLAGLFRYGAFELAVSERLAGMVAMTAGQFDDAERHLTEAERIARDDPNPLDAPHVDLWFAKLLLARGRPEDRPEANRRARAAHAVFVRRGTPPYTAMAEDVLRALGGA
ncbi:MAG TPA: AAA family ATPase [Acidimicrobiales bacterium]|nr:AAA family ATPase [Acidimicrobiales bacterium]